MSMHVAREEHLESSKKILDQALRPFLKNADYVLIGGVAISRPDVFRPGARRSGLSRKRNRAPRRTVADPGPLFIPGD